MLAGASHGVRSVKFFDGKQLIATEKRGSEGLFTTHWRTRKARAGRHVLRAVVTDRGGATASATRRRPRVPTSRRHRRLERDRGGGGESPARARLGLRARRAPRGAAAPARRGARRRVGALRRRRPRGGRAHGRRDRRAPPARLACSSTTPASPAAAASCGPPPERIEEVTRTNYLGGVWCLRAFLPALEAAAPSDVVNVVSVAGTVAAGLGGPYTASKHAQLALLALGLRGAGAAGDPRAHDPARVRRDRGLPAARALRPSR